jgi:hypothetical protein
MCDLPSLPFVKKKQKSYKNSSKPYFDILLAIFDLLHIINEWIP